MLMFLTSDGRIGRDTIEFRDDCSVVIDCNRENPSTDNPVPLHDVPAPSIKTYAAAELSLLAHGPVPLPIYEHRLSCCTGSPCQHMKSDDDGQYCASCKCGTRKRARLKIKLHMPKAKCPYGIWGEEQGEGIMHLSRIGGLLAQVKGIISNIKDELAGKNKEAKDG